MTEREYISSLPINPWLGEQVGMLREKYAVEDLRYMFINLAGEGVSWADFLCCRAIIDCADKNPFILNHRYSLDLPELTQEILNRNHVDCVGDILQLTENELKALLGKEETEKIKSILSEHDLSLRRCPRRTFKLSTEIVMSRAWDTKDLKWTIQAPSPVNSIDLSRPSAADSWFEAYYEKYERVWSEEYMSGRLRRYRPDISRGEMPYDYSEFFNALGNFWSSYEILCKRYEIRNTVPQPDYPKCAADLADFTNDRFIYLKRQTVRALLTVLEYIHIWGRHTAGEYLEADDSGKLEATEECIDEDLQQLLISFVEVRVDYENIVVYMALLLP